MIIFTVIYSHSLFSGSPDQCICWNLFIEHAISGNARGCACAIAVASILYLVIYSRCQVLRSVDGVQVGIFGQLVELVGIVQGHMRSYLPDILTLIDRYWSLQRLPLLNILLNFLAVLAKVLQDDFRQYVSDLLPKFVALFQDAERSGNFNIVEPGLLVRCDQSCF